MEAKKPAKPNPPRTRNGEEIPKRSETNPARSESSAPEAIIRQVRKHQIDLLVMGTVCRTGLSGFFIGNTAEKVLGNVDCSVLTLKPEGFVSPVTLQQG